MLKVLYMDRQIIVVYKEYGILSQADSSNDLDMLTLIKDYIKEKEKREKVFLGLVHRLDRNTKGVMVFARTSKAAKRLQEQILNNTFKKKYIAIVEGNINEEGTINIKLKKDENKKIAYYSNDGKDSILNYTVINKAKLNNIDITYLDIELKTGRFHQIRASFSHYNHPLYGDIKYGSLNKTSNAFLQAYYLEFRHPISNELLVFKEIDYQNNFRFLERVEGK